MTTMIDVIRHHWGGMASESDVEVRARLDQEVRQFEAFGAVPNNVFSLRPTVIDAFKSGDPEAFAWAIGVPWPVPEHVTLKSLAADLDALTAKFKKFAGV